jgi:hypothetical protein
MYDWGLTFTFPSREGPSDYTEPSTPGDITNCLIPLLGSYHHFVFRLILASHRARHRRMSIPTEKQNKHNSARN